MRSVGKYKDKDIRMRAMYIQDTYLELLVGSKNNKSLNLEIVSVKTDKQASELFGSHVPYHIADRESIVLDKALPPETVYALLECYSPIKEGEGSWLVLIWFQQNSDDPYKVLNERLNSISWEECARDFEGD